MESPRKQGISAVQTLLMAQGAAPMWQTKAKPYRRATIAAETRVLSCAVLMFGAQKPWLHQIDLDQHTRLPVTTHSWLDLEL